MLEQRLETEAMGEEKLGVAKADARKAMVLAEAEGEQRMGHAKAEAREAMAKAEAAGLVEKLKAYDACLRNPVTLKSSA